jgi:hypothetical protein
MNNAGPRGQFSDRDMFGDTAFKVIAFAYVQDFGCTSIHNSINRGVFGKTPGACAHRIKNAGATSANCAHICFVRSRAEFVQYGKIIFYRQAGEALEAGG